MRNALIALGFGLLIGYGVSVAWDNFTLLREIDARLLTIGKDLKYE